MLKILFLGDITGRTGRNIVQQLLPDIKSEYAPDVIIANGENSAGGAGIDPKVAAELLAMGIDVITTGNHIWKRREAIDLVKQNPKQVIRPLNFPKGAPGVGLTTFEANGTKINIVNAMGRVFVDAKLDCPFQTVDALLKNELKDEKVIFVDFHAEATSEKEALGFFLDGRVSAVIGTHTHVQTADEKILPDGTAYLSDAGMCGAKFSVLGVEHQPIVQNFLSGTPVKFDIAKGIAILNGVVITCDEQSGKAIAIERIFREL